MLILHHLCATHTHIQLLVDLHESHTRISRTPSAILIFSGGTVQATCWSICQLAMPLHTQTELQTESHTVAHMRTTASLTHPCICLHQFRSILYFYIIIFSFSDTSSRAFSRDRALQNTHTHTLRCEIYATHLYRRASSRAHVNKFVSIDDVLESVNDLNK